MSRSSSGGHPGVPIPLDHLAPGGIRLDKSGRIDDGSPKVNLPPRTKRTVDFQGCNAGIYAVLDENNVCLHYKLMIVDPWENVTYSFDFLTDVREQWETQLGSMPLVGEKPPESPAADAA